jgi:hypothetical protein
MSHERDAIARAFSRPFIEPPKRPPAKRIGFTLAGVALLAAGLIVSERQRSEPAASEVSNGVECATTSIGEGYYNHERIAPSKPISGTVRIEFIPGNLARYHFGAEISPLEEPMTTTGLIYKMVAENVTTTINRETGEFHRDIYIEENNKDWWRTTFTGTCHAIQFDAKM